MIEAPINVLMAAIVPRLKADASLQGLIGQRVYDAAPLKSAYPYLSFGSAWETPEDADCIPALDVGFRIDAWSYSESSTGFAEVRRISHRVRDILHNLEIDLPEGALAMLEHRRTDVMRNLDGKISHAAIEFSAVIET